MHGHLLVNPSRAPWERCFRYIIRYRYRVAHQEANSFKSKTYYMSEDFGGCMGHMLMYDREEEG